MDPAKLFRRYNIMCYCLWPCWNDGVEHVRHHSNPVANNEHGIVSFVEPGFVTNADKWNVDMMRASHTTRVYCISSLTHNQLAICVEWWWWTINTNRTATSMATTTNAMTIAMEIRSRYTILFRGCVRFGDMRITLLLCSCECYLGKWWCVCLFVYVACFGQTTCCKRTPE